MRAAVLSQLTRAVYQSACLTGMQPAVTLRTRCSTSWLAAQAGCLDGNHAVFDCFLDNNNLPGRVTVEWRQYFDVDWNSYNNFTGYGPE